ncbi:NAD-dependent epimerase/dehydratase [Trichoderma sp. SZMC 28011]
MSLNILVVGGTGVVGGYAALYLHSIGHNITLGGRSQPQALPLSKFPFLKGSYINAEFTKEQLSPFDAVVFTAGQDYRHLPPNVMDMDAYFLQANGKDIPAFAKLARDAGVKQFIHVGSFYWRLFPEMVDGSAYMRSRKLESDGVVALASPSFSAVSINPPFLAGAVSETLLAPFSQELVQYYTDDAAASVAPPGGLAFLSLRSLSEAIAGAVRNRNDVSGKQLFIADENLSYEAFFDLFRRALGLPERPMTLDLDHPVFPRGARIGGDGFAFWQPDEETEKLLGDFTRNDIYRAVVEAVEMVKLK